MRKIIFNEEKFIKDVVEGIKADDDSIRDTVETTVVRFALPFAFETLGWMNVPLGLIAAGCNEAGLNPCDYFDIEA